MKEAIILRGVSGSGKSTLARELVGESGRIHSTDSYFYDAEGNYRFDGRKLGEYHAANLNAFTHSLKGGASPVICDNTNVQHWQYAPYVEAAKAHGYKVTIVSLPHPPAEVAAARNLHGVPLTAVQRMLAQWED